MPLPGDRVQNTGRFDELAERAEQSNQQSGRFERLAEQAESQDSAGFLEAAGDIASAAGKIGLSGIQGFNRGVTQILGLPGDLANLTARSLGFESQPFAGSETVQNAIGTALGDEQFADRKTASPFVTRIGEELGAAAVPAGLFLRGAGKSARAFQAAAPSMARKSLTELPSTQILRSAGQTPGRFLAAEGSAAAGAGTGAAIAQTVDPNDPSSELVGQLVGGFASPLSLGTRLSQRFGGEAKARAADSAQRVTPKGQREQAAEVIRNAAESKGGSRKETLKILNDDPLGVPGAQLTPAQETQNIGLLQIERIAANRIGEVQGNLQKAAEATEAAIGRQAEELADEQDVTPQEVPALQERPREVIQGRLDRLKGALDARGQVALENAQQRIANLEPGQVREEGAKVVRDEIEKALNDARSQERSLAEAIPEAQAPTSNLQQALNRVTSGNVPLIRESEVPGVVRDAFKRLGKRRLRGATLQPTGTIKDIQQIRSRVLDAQRDAASGATPNRRAVKAFGELQAAALDDIAQASEGQPEIEELLRFSRDLNERFTQGAIGRLLGFEQTGALRVQPEQTLADLFSKQGESAGVNLDALRAALRDRPEAAARANETVEEFIRQRFSEQVAPEGEVPSTKLIQRFVNNNAELLNRFPELKKQIQDAQQASRIAKEQLEKSGNRKQTLTDQNVSRAALFLNAPVGQELARVQRSKDPVRAMRELVRQVRGDRQALAGLRSQAIRNLFGKSQLENLEQNALTGVSADALDKAFRNRERVFSESGLFTQEQMDRLRQAVDTFKKAEANVKGGRDIEELIDQSADGLTDTALRVLGANVGASAAPGLASLQTAQIGSQKLRELGSSIPQRRVFDIIAEAAQDRELMRTLLEEAKSPRRQSAIQRRLDGFVANILSTATEPSDQQERNKDRAQ